MYNCIINVIFQTCFSPDPVVAELGVLLLIEEDHPTVFLVSQGRLLWCVLCVLVTCVRNETKPKRVIVKWCSKNVWSFYTMGFVS